MQVLPTHGWHAGMQEVSSTSLSDAAPATTSESCSEIASQAYLVQYAKSRQIDTSAEVA